MEYQLPVLSGSCVGTTYVLCVYSTHVHTCVWWSIGCDDYIVVLSGSWVYASLFIAGSSKDTAEQDIQTHTCPQ